MHLSATICAHSTKLKWKTLHGCVELSSGPNFQQNYKLMIGMVNLIAKALIVKEHMSDKRYKLSCL